MNMTMIISMGKSKSVNSKLRRRKKSFLLSLAVFFCIVLYFLFSPLLEKSNEGKINEISVALCGAVENPAVYRLKDGSSLANLIVTANGLSINANVDSLNFNIVLEKDKVYHIPFRKKNISLDTLRVKKLISSNSVSTDKEINILYVGYPALYFIMSYNEAKHKATFTYIPYSTVFLDNEFRLIDIFFTLGIDYTVDVLQKSMNKKIDYYYMQDRASFVEMINSMGGVDINVDKDFADEYDIKGGKQLLNGDLAYKYISFIRSKNNNVLDIYKYQELFNNKRRSRQKEVIVGMYKRINSELKDDAGNLYRNVFRLGDARSNIGLMDFTSILTNVLHKNSLNFQVIPGEYKFTRRRLYYIPASKGYKLLKTKQKHDIFNLHKGKEEQIIY